MKLEIDVNIIEIEIRIFEILGFEHSHKFHHEEYGKYDLCKRLKRKRERQTGKKKEMDRERHTQKYRADREREKEGGRERSVRWKDTECMCTHGIKNERVREGGRGGQWRGWVGGRE